MRMIDSLTSLTDFMRVYWEPTLPGEKCAPKKIDWIVI
jgi:hypothetical protein